MPIPLGVDFDAARLRAAARESKDAGQTRRLLPLAAIYDGASRLEAAGIGGVTVQIVRDWVVKLNAHGPDGLVDYKGPGPQENKITRRWALCGTRPIAPHDQRTASTYIFGAICPAEGKAAGLVLPWCNTEAMNLRKSSAKSARCARLCLCGDSLVV